MPNRTIKMPNTPWASTAVDVPVTPTTGVTYRNYNLTDGESDTAWPYKIIVGTPDINELLYRLTALMQMLEFNGVLPWHAGITYGQYALVTGSDGKQYRSLQAANINHDPVTVPSAWWVDLDKLYAKINNDIGVVKWFAGETPPEDHMECDGGSLNRVTHAALFAVIGTAFGAVDSNSFNRPDLRGVFVRGWDHGRGMDMDAALRTAQAPGGATGDHVGTYQADGIKAHTHTVSGIGIGEPQFAATGGTGSNSSIVTTSSIGGNETRGKNTYLMPIIRYQ